MTNPGRLLPVLFFSLLSFWPSFCFSDFFISTIHYPLLVLWADVQRTRFLSHELEVRVPFQQRLGSATQGDFSPAWKFLATIVAVALRNVRPNQQRRPRCSASHAARSAKPPNVFPVLEISSPFPATICASAPKPSCRTSCTGSEAGLISAQCLLRGWSFKPTRIKSGRLVC